MASYYPAYSYIAETDYSPDQGTADTATEGSAPKSDGVPEGNDGEDPHFINFETISLPEDLLDMWGMFEGWDPFWICLAGGIICVLLMVCSTKILLPFLMVGTNRPYKTNNFTIKALTDGLYTVLCSRRRVFFRPSYGPSSVSNRAKSRRTKSRKKDYKPIKEAKPANVSLVNEVRKLYDENPPREPPRPNFKNYNSFN